METYDAVKESVGDQSRRVRVAEGDEVRVLGEPVDNGEDDGLSVDLGKALDEVHRDIRPHLGRNVERLKKACRLESRCLVALEHDACTNKVVDKPAVAGNVEVLSQAHEGLLDTLVAGSMSQHDRLMMQVILCWHKNVLTMEEEAIVGGPRHP